MVSLTVFVAVLLFPLDLYARECPSFPGSFFIEQEDLYPESADYDPETCRLFLSSMYNDSIVIYDLFTRTTRNVDIPRITHPGTDNYTDFHVNGIDYDPGSGHIFVAASSATAFTSILSEGVGGVFNTNYSNANYTGPNYVVVFDPKKDDIIAEVSLVPAQEQYESLTGHLTNGFQDMSEIVRTGDTYAIGTFGSSIVRIPYSTNRSELWYAPKVYNAPYDFGGIVSYEHKLIVSSTLTGGLVRFDTREKDPELTYVPLQGLPDDYRSGNADGLYVPHRYEGRVALWSDDYNGTSVYGTQDDRESAHFLGLISNDDPGVYEGALTTDSFEIGDNIYGVTQFFVFDLPAKPSRNWPFYDITAELDDIVQRSFLGDSTGNF